MITSYSIRAFIRQSLRRQTTQLLLEAEAVYEAKHVVLCNVEVNKYHIATFAGLVLQTTPADKDMHGLGIAETEKLLQQRACSYKAG